METSEVDCCHISSKQARHQNENVFGGRSAIGQVASETGWIDVPELTHQAGPSPVLPNESGGTGMALYSLVDGAELHPSSNSVSNERYGPPTENIRSTTINCDCPPHVPLAHYQQGSIPAPTPQNCISTEQLRPHSEAITSCGIDANFISSPKNNATKISAAEKSGPSGCVSGIIISREPGQMETPPETSGRTEHSKDSLVQSHRALSSRLYKKPKVSEEVNNVADVSCDGMKQCKKRKKRGERRVVDEFSSIRNRLRNLLQRMSYEQSLINAYSSEGWKGLSREKLKPDSELKRAKCDISRCKLKIRGLFQRLDSLNLEGKVPETLFDSEGRMDAEDIFCAKCGSKDVPVGNDIILCDSCNRGFHQHCLKPPLLKEDIPPGDEAWMCPGCVCKFECVKLINYSQETNLSTADNWEKVFPEATEEQVDEDVELPSAGSDDDYIPDGENADENNQESSDSGSDEAEYTSDEEIYGDLPSDSSDENDWSDTAAPSGEEAIDDVSVFLNRDVPVYKKEMVSGIRKCRRQKVSEKMNIDDTDNSPATLHGGSSISGSNSESARPSTYKKLGDDVIKILLSSFKENNYPARARKESLAQELGLTFQQVSQWFNNRRASFRRSSCAETSTSQSTSQDIASFQSDKELVDPRQK